MNMTETPVRTLLLNRGIWDLSPSWVLVKQLYSPDMESLREKLDPTSFLLVWWGMVENRGAPGHIHSEPQNATLFGTVANVIGLESQDALMLAGGEP